MLKYLYFALTRRGLTKFLHSKPNNPTSLTRDSNIN